MKKRVLALLISVCQVLVLLPAAAGAATADDLVYEITNGTAIITGCSEEVRGYLVIPDTVEGCPVTGIGNSAFENCGSLTGVMIPEGVTRIGEFAFSQCGSLTGITIPDSVNSIGDYAFYSCGSLTDVVIPAGVTSIGDYVFSLCGSLTEITVAEDNPAYSSQDGVLFDKAKTILLCCPGGKAGECTIPESVNGIAGYAFQACSGLTGVNIPAGVITIGEAAFYDCSALTDITIPENVTSIGRYTFSGCSSLTSLTIPKGVTQYDWVWACGEYLTSIEVADENPVYASKNGVLYNKAQTKLLLYPGRKADTGFAIDNGVTAIADFAFYHAVNLVNVAIPDSVLEIGDYLFAGCSSLTDICVDAGNPCYCSEGGALLDKPGATLLRCPEGKTGAYTIPNGVTEIGALAFYGCNSLTSVIIPDSMDHIGNAVFADCSGLESVALPAGVTGIGNFAFYNCSSLTDIGLPAGVKSIGGFAFYGCTALTDIVIPEATAGIGPYAFYNCIRLTDIAIPAGVTDIGNYTFYNCRKLTSVMIPESVTGIGSCAFENCSSLTEVFYTGGEEAWSAISVDSGNEALLAATIHYNSVIDTEPAEPIVFEDVPGGEYYAAPVAWAVEKGITNGMTETTFEPNTTCTRAQIVTFLWRAAGEPEPTSAYNPFTDVHSTDCFYKAVLWAVEKGITNGMTETTFVPDGECTRGQAVTFLWRSAGQPAPPSANTPFTDVSSTEYYYQAVLWAAENGVTYGMTPTAFAPDRTCTRAQIVTFLYRTVNPA